MERRKKFRRMGSFDTQSFQITMMDKKNLGRAAQMSAVGYTIGTSKGQNVNQTRIHTRRTGQSPKKSNGLTNISNSIRAKRNLSFDDPSLGTNPAMTTHTVGLRRSPRKRVATRDIIPTVQVSSLKGDKRTPSKRTPSKIGFVTPCKMTPGKSHQLYAPETPKNKENNRRKTDGVACVAESPDLDQIKGLRGERTTPRRVAASLNLRKKTSFYSGDVSRNLMKAEELIKTTQLQSFSVFQHNTIERTRKCSLGQQKQSDESFDKLDAHRRDSCGVLFPHLVQSNQTHKTKDSGHLSDDLQNKSPTLSERNQTRFQDCSTGHDKGNARATEFKTTSSDLRKDSGCPSDLISNAESVGTIPSRKLLSDMPTINSDMTPSRIFKRKEVRKIALTPVAIGKNGCFDNRHIHPAFAKEPQNYSPPENANVSDSLNQSRANCHNASLVLSDNKPVKLQGTEFIRDEGMSRDKKKSKMVEASIINIEGKTLDFSKSTSNDLSNNTVELNHGCDPMYTPRKDPLLKDNSTPKKVSQENMGITDAKYSPNSCLSSKENTNNPFALPDDNIKPINENTITKEKDKGNSVDLKLNNDQTEPLIKASRDKVKTPQKPSRKRKATTRLGIDDITLNEVVCSLTPKGRLTPKHLRSIVLLKKHQIRSKPQIMQVTSANDAPEICDNYTTAIPSAKRRKLSNQFSLMPNKNNDFCNTKSSRLTRGDPEVDINSHSTDCSQSEHSQLCAMLPGIHKESPEKPTLLTGENTNVVTDEIAVGLKSPGKFWSVVSRTESPHGEIKLCINRKKKPQVGISDIFLEYVFG